MMRTIFFYVCIIISFFVTSFFRIKVKFLTDRGDIKQRGDYIHKVVSTWARFIMNISGARVNVIGLENIPKDQTVLFVSNHQSNFDIPLLISSIDISKGFIAKKELERWPFISTWMKYINCIFMDRDNLRKSAQSIIEGEIFDHGTRFGGSKNPSLNLVANSRRNDTLISTSEMRPCLTASKRSL